MSNTLQAVALLGALGAGAAYLAATGQFGQGAQKAVTGAIAKATGQPGPPPCGPPYGNLATMMAANHNVQDQFILWQQERRANGQSPVDWNAFRVHVQAIYGPDPGPNPPQEFCQSAASGYIPGSTR